MSEKWRLRPNKKRRWTAAALCIVLFGSQTVFYESSQKADTAENAPMIKAGAVWKETMKDGNANPVETDQNTKESSIEEPKNLYAQSAILMDADSGRILFEKNGQQARPMASTTKIVTCILALEYGNLDEIVTVSANAASQPAVRLGAAEGQQFVLRDLLYALMLESHNDVAVMIAEHIGGSVEGFADMMNAKAMEIGCTDTYFITPNGLDDSDENGVHHTTAEDLARLMRYCINTSSKHGEFLAVTQTDSYQFQDCTNVYTYSCQNHNTFLHMMEGALSGKTGFTNDAGYCYVGALKRGEKTLITALLACGWPNNKNYKWSDTRTLMTYGLENFDYEIIDREEMTVKIPIIDGVPDANRLSGSSTADVKIIYPKAEKKVLLRHDQKIKVSTNLMKELLAPVEAGEDVGEVVYTVNGETICKYAVKIRKGVRKRDYRWCCTKIVRIYLK